MTTNQTVQHLSDTGASELNPNQVAMLANPQFARIPKFICHTSRTNPVKVLDHLPAPNSFLVIEMEEGTDTLANLVWTFVLDPNTNPPTYSEQFPIYVNGEVQDTLNFPAVDGGTKNLYFFTGEEMCVIGALVTHYTPPAP